MTTPKLTMAMPSYADPLVRWVLAMLRRDARMHNVLGQFKLLLVEQHPNSPQGQINKKDIESFGGRFIPMPEPLGTAPPRNRLFAEADTEWVLCMDSHVWLDFDVLPKLLEFCQDNPSQDLHFGPLLNTNQVRKDGSLSVQWTHWTEGFGGDGMYGTARAEPKVKEPDCEPFPVTHAGCGLFLARRDAWLGFHPDMRGFGVEGYLGRAYWKAGRQVWLLPWLKWLHHFKDRSLPAEFPNRWSDRTLNMVIQWEQLGSPLLSEIKANHVEFHRHNKETGRLEFMPRTTPGQWKRIMQDRNIDEVAVIAAEQSGQAMPEKPAVVPATKEGYLQQLPCRHRVRESGTILCNRGCPSQRSIPHPIFDCKVHGVVALSKIHTGLQACVGCEQREEPGANQPTKTPAPKPIPVEKLPQSPPAAGVIESRGASVRMGQRVILGKPAKRPDLVIVGGPYSSPILRGRQVAERMGVPYVDYRSEPVPKARTILLVKHWPDDIGALRRNCDQLIYDPMDVFWQTPTADPVEYWAGVIKTVQPDTMIATSPAAGDLMIKARAKHVAIGPHHADERIGAGWYCRFGAVVYAGLRQFLGKQEDAIRAACKDLGREFIARHDADCWQALDGAALALAVRCDGAATELNRSCKPQIKLANAARAGIPVLATADPAVLSLCPSVPTTTGDWKADIASALESMATVHRWNLDTHCDLIRSLMNGPTVAPTRPPAQRAIVMAPVLES